MQGTCLTVSLWQQLMGWDQRLFIKLNREWTNPFFDAVFPYLRDSVFWAPLYIFILAFVTINFGKKGWWWSIFFIISVALADTIGTKVFKDGFQRLRPCSDPEFFFQVRLLLKQCSGSFSFTSNHAANHFAMATFAVLTFRGIFRKWMSLAYIWAFFIAYAQVYVGVHYPLDVIGGALLGVLAGLLSATLYTKYIANLNMDNPLT
jgi:undecaprenyl-diphosphatase